MFLVAPLTSLPVILTLDPFLCKVGSEWELRNLSLHQNYRADQRLQYSRKHYFDIYYQSCGIRKNYEITLRNKSFLKIRWRFDDNLSIVRRCHKVDASIIQSAIKQSNWKRCFFEGKKSILTHFTSSAQLSTSLSNYLNEFKYTSVLKNANSMSTWTAASVYVTLRKQICCKRIFPSALFLQCWKICLFKTKKKNKRASAPKLLSFSD